MTYKIDFGYLIYNCKNLAVIFELTKRNDFKDLNSAERMKVLGYCN